jgi:hypothetical protein
MIAWLLAQKNPSCSNSCEESLFNLVVAFIYIFTFFNVKDEPTRYKYLTFYVINFLENTVLLCTWFFSFNLTTPEILMFRISGLVGHYALFFLGILCMVLYYVYFHPSVGAVSKEMKDSAQNVPVPLPSSEPKMSKILARKGSIDHTHFPGAVNNSHSASSSRKNVSLGGDTTSVPYDSRRQPNNGQVLRSQEVKLNIAIPANSKLSSNDNRQLANSDETKL